MGYTTDTIDFAYNNGFLFSNDGGGWLEHVHLTAANRSDEAAPSVANSGLGNIDETFFDLYFDSPGQQQQLTLLAPSQRDSNTRGDLSGQSNYQSSFSNFILTPPESTVYPPLSRLSFRDEAEIVPTEDPAQRVIQPSIPSV